MGKEFLIQKKINRRKALERTFPILRWAPAYTKKQAVADLIAGLTVGLTVLPQGLAYATVAGLPPIYGLYSAFIGCFVYVIFGSTKAITIGPTAIQCVLVHKYVFGRSPEYAVFLCLVTGVFTFLMGVCQLGFIANFVSSPVNSAFTSGVALTIVATQIKLFLGIKFDDEGFLPTIIGLYDHVSEINKWDAILSVFCCVILLFLKKLQFIFKCFAGLSHGVDKALWLISTARSIIIIIVCTLFVVYLGPQQPFSLVGNIAPGLPELQPPPLEIFEPADNHTHTFMEILEEQKSALVVLPFLSIMGHMTIAKAFAGSNRVDATQEILTIGITNLISCFFSSMPVGGSFSRTTVNAMSGVETPLGGLYTGVIVLLALEFLTPYFYFIPNASLAAVIVCSVIFMVDLEIIMPMWRCKRMDMIPWGATFFVTLFVGLEYGIFVGIGISTVFLLYYAARPQVKITKGATTAGITYIMIDLDRSLTFPSVDFTTYEISKTTRKCGVDKIPIVLDCHHIQYVDFTAAQAMRSTVENLKDQGYTLIFFKMKSSVERIIGSIMATSSAPFILCSTYDQLDKVITQDVSYAVIELIMDSLFNSSKQGSLSSQSEFNIEVRT